MDKFNIWRVLTRVQTLCLALLEQIARDTNSYQDNMPSLSKISFSVRQRNTLKYIIFEG